MEVQMTSVLSPAAQALIDAGITAANQGGDAYAVGRAVEQAVADLSFSLPVGKKAQVNDVLIEIAKAYASIRVSRDSLEGAFGAEVAKLPQFGSSLFFKLDTPIRSMKYAVALSGTPGFVDFWNKVGKSEPVGRHVTISKMKTGSDAFKVEGFAIDDGDHDSLR
jgi:hypothetical protein